MLQLRNMGIYTEMKERHQAEVNAFPLHFAFGDAQIDAKLKELGLTRKNYQNHIVVVFHGCFILKKDKEAYYEMFRRHAQERAAAMEADVDGSGYLYEMFKTELCNHEYGYTGDVTDTLMALGLNARDIAEKPTFKAALERAAGEILRGA